MNKGDPNDYVVVPEEAFEHLPEEWKEAIESLKEEGAEVLASAEKNLRNLNRLVHAFPTMASLRYIHHRLTSTTFEPTIEWVFETDMLTLAFVTTYSRLIQGGLGSGVSKKEIPRELRPIHDKIIELRNKRYAHNEGHDSIKGRMDIGFENGEFDIKVKFEMGFHVGGAVEWEPLVAFLDELMSTRLHVQLDRLREKTGREWHFPSGPPPAWVKPDEFQ